MKTALLVVDVQHALCVGRWAAFDIERVVERINGLANRARAAGAPVVFVQHEEGEGPMQAGGDGWQLHDGLARAGGDTVLAKTACDAFHRTPLHALLQAQGVAKVVVCGLQSEFCVDSTVRGALAHGYEVVLAADAHSTLDNGVIAAATIVAHHNATLANLGSYGPTVAVIPSSDIRIPVRPVERP